MARHSKIPKAQRPELVLAVLRGTEKLEVLARRHQVSANTLRRWRDEFLAAGKAQRNGTGDSGHGHRRCDRGRRCTKRWRCVSEWVIPR